MAVIDLNKARKLKAEDQMQKKRKLQDRKELRDDVERYGHIDFPLLAVLITLIAYGLIMLFSASMSSAYAASGDPLNFVSRQAGFTLLGIVVCGIFLLLPIRKYNRFIFTVIVYIVCTLCLLGVMVAGVEGDYGAQRWLKIGPVQFQPSEMCKVAAIYCLATYWPAMKQLRAKGFLTVKDNPRKDAQREAFIFFTFPACLMGIWMVLILAQPHFSGAIIVFLLVLSLFLVAKLPGRIWVKGLMQLIPIILVGILLFVMIYPVLNPGESLIEKLGQRFAHVTSRLDTFSNPEEASRDSTHQTVQGRLALGAGGLTGKGLGKGRQKSGFLPMVYNDFILPSIGEELGFLGTLSVILLFMAFFILGVKVSSNARGLYYALMAWGGTFLIIIQALLNIAVAAEVIPPTGISLPFFSYGGTSHVFMMLAASFVLSVSKTGQRVDKELGRIILMERNYQRVVESRVK